jgi:diguanylate cyclase (GGDEF)-like protein
VTDEREDEGDDATPTVTPIVEHSPRPIRRGDACLVVIYGSDLGRRVPLTQGTFEIGRASRSDLPIDQESVSRQHARITKSKDGSFAILDLGSTNGTYVNDVAVSEAKLHDGDQLKIGRSILKFMTGDNVEASYHEEIYRLMTVDGLTQLYNKRFFGEALEREVNRAKRYGRPLALLLLDIDHFKRKNDEYGHVAGDAVLRQLAATVLPKLRRDDIFARVGGEEFAILLPELDAAAAQATGERIRKIVEDARFSFDRVEIACTVSCGIAHLDETTSAPADLYRTADSALYRAKQEGRNCVRS